MSEPMAPTALGAGAGLPTVFAVLLNWNGWADTRACLDSLRRVTYPRLRIVLVDNGSSDGSVAGVRAGYPEVHLIAKDANLGFAGGNNRGIAYALGAGADYVLLLNNDTVVDPGFLEPLLAAFARDPGVGFAGAKIYYYDRPGVVWFFGGAIDWASGWAYHQSPNHADASGRYAAQRATPFVTGCCLLARREVWARVGGLDQRFFLIYEDVDWCVRATRAGYRGVVVADSHIWHKVSASFRRDLPALGTFYFVRNGLLFIRKHAPHPVLAAWRFAWIWALKPSLREARRGARFWPRRLMLRGSGVLTHLLRRYGAAPGSVARWLGGL